MPTPDLFSPYYIEHSRAEKTGFGAAEITKRAGLGEG